MRRRDLDPRSAALVAARGGHLPLGRQARGNLRRRGHRHVHPQHGPIRRGRAIALGDPRMQARARRRAVPRRRGDVLQLEHREDRARGVAAARHRAFHIAGDDQLAARPSRRHTQPRREGGPPGDFLAALPTQVPPLQRVPGVAVFLNPARTRRRSRSAPRSSTTTPCTSGCWSFPSRR